ncbi:MAG TPA: phosphoenolpyruvate--protein phosphotransferase [Pyrinomonadaceae bacterium]
MSRRVKDSGAEQFWRGVAVSEGLAVGRVLRLHGGAQQSIYRATLNRKDVTPEVARFYAAVELARSQLLGIKERAERALGAEQAYIFDAHLLMLEDRKLLDEVEAYIRRERANAEWAVRVAADRLLAVYEEIKDDYLRERSSDIEDVARRLLVALAGAHVEHKLTADAVIVAEELLPSAAAEMDFAHVRAVATDAGGWTSHTAIIARGLGLPAVVGLRELYRHARTGDEIIVDALRGEVILHPAPRTVARCREEMAHTRPARQRSTLELAQQTHAPLRTQDGVEIALRANVELPIEYEGVRRFNAQGIGLYRTEFLLSQRGRMPTEDEQCEAYLEVAALAGADGAKVRLFDLGGDKLGTDDGAAERNPALGLRAIRFFLRREDVLRTQVRAILRAAARGRLDLVLPMVSDVAEVRRTRRIIETEQARLRSEGRDCGPVKIGAMIEVPSAVLTADRLARAVDFFSLGTNDLVQYLLAVDRGNDSVADWFRTLHPAVLQSIRHALSAAAHAGIPASVCGEMAATPVYAVVLVGLGARDLSMTTSSIPRVRRVLAGVSAARAREIADECVACETADEVEELVRVRLGAEWPQLFPPGSLPAPKQTP